VIVGGGIAGNSLATVLGRAGWRVLVLERSAVYRDKVRGEIFHAWGVAETQRLGLYDALREAGGVHHSRLVPYDEILPSAEAEAAGIALHTVIPGVPGTLGIGHPAACAALAATAVAAGARVSCGVSDIDVVLGSTPTVRYRMEGVAYLARCRLVIGADGRESAIRRLAGIPLHSTVPRLLMAGMLVEDLWRWPDDTVTIGTEGNLVFFVVPQGAGRVRLYLLWSCRDRERFAGARGPRTFLDSFGLSCLPGSEWIVQAKLAGPCAWYPMNDSWTESPVVDGLALIGDAAGYSDPHIGQGLSVAMRDVRILSELLLSSADWSPDALRPYAEERAERMRRLRFCSALATTLRGEFGAEARERRRRALQLMQQEPSLGQWRRAYLAGPDSVPPSAFDERVSARLCGHGATPGP